MKGLPGPLRSPVLAQNTAMQTATNWQTAATAVHA